MNGWKACGYVPRGVFAGAAYCWFRLTHRRADGLHICTVGDYRRGGRLEPVLHGRPFLTVVLYPPADDQPQAEGRRLTHATSVSWQDADELHHALMHQWAEASPMEKADTT